MRRPLLVATIFLGVAALPAAAQTRTVVLPEGTEVVMETIDQLSSKTAAEEDPISLRVVESVIVDGAVAIAAGTMVKGSVSDVGRKGRMGKSGRINIRIESTTAVDLQKVPLRASRGGEGEGRVGTTVALTVLFGPLGLLKSGKDAVIKAGTKVTAFTGQTMTVAVRPASTPGAEDKGSPTLLAGIWTAQVHGGTFTMSLSQSESTLAGSGDFMTSAGRSDNFSVSGFAAGSDFALTFTLPSSRIYFNGKQVGSGVLEGTMVVSGQPDAVVTFTKR